MGMALFLPMLFDLLLIFFILSPVISQSDASDTDLIYKCGSLNFTYPFSLYNPNSKSAGEAAPRCGFPGLTVLCQDGITPVLPLGSTNFSILSIDVNRSIVRLSNPDAPTAMDVSYCPIITQGINLPTGSILNKTTNDVDLTFLYGCNTIIHPSFSPLQCLASNFSHRPSYIYAGDDLPPLYDYDQSCYQVVKTVGIVPADNLQSINTTFAVALIGGFELTWKWDSDECDECKQSGGWCSYTQSTTAFSTCFRSSMDCRTQCFFSNFYT